MTRRILLSLPFAFQAIPSEPLDVIYYANRFATAYNTWAEFARQHPPEQELSLAELRLFKDMEEAFRAFARYHKDLSNAVR